MMPPTSIDGTDITGATIDGTDVTEITVDGDTVFTAGPTIIDDFEDNNITEYSGDTLKFKTQSAIVLNGSFALENDTSTGSEIMFRTDAVSSGDTVRYFTNNNGQLFSRFLWGFDGSDGYLIDTRAPKIRIFRVDTGSLVFLGDASASIPSSGFYQVDIEFDSPNIDIEVRSLAGSLLSTFSTTDATHTNTGFGFSGDPGVIFDDVTIL